MDTTMKTLRRKASHALQNSSRSVLRDLEIDLEADQLMVIPGAAGPSSLVEDALRLLDAILERAKELLPRPPGQEPKPENRPWSWDKKPIPEFLN